jgi:hypothetical protein
MQKSKFNYIYPLIAIIIGVFGYFQYEKLSQDIVISFTEDQVQETIDATPIKEFSKLGINVNIHHLNIDFLETNEVLIDLDFFVNGFTMEAIGKGQLKTKILYSNGNFYINEPEFKDFSLNVQKQKSNIEKAKVILNKFFVDKISNKFNEEKKVSFKNLSNSFIEKHKSQVKLMIEEKITKVLSETPVYSLNNKDIKQSIVALILQDIKFTDKEAVATLKPTAIFQSPLFIIGISLIGLLLIVFFVVRR